LLLTDVVMPQMNGRILAEKIRAIFPKIKTIFMSGYTANVIAHHGILDEDIVFLPKPLNLKELSVKVRQTLAN
ncbi:MAG TPA: response regulator, partial [Candidatus Marinimicrobia bacterium]|nr:response regulator [Candidatus Neomarinimicrobiota bacterium]